MTKKGIGVAYYIQELADRDSGFEAVEEIALPPKVLRHQESYDEGYASGYIEACVNLSQQNRSLAIQLYHGLLLSPCMAVEWSLRVLREIDPSVPRGRLARNHPRAPKQEMVI